MAYGQDKKQISIGFEKELFEAIKKLADNDKRSISSYVSIVMQKHVEEVRKQSETKE